MSSKNKLLNFASGIWGVLRYEGFLDEELCDKEVACFTLRKMPQMKKLQFWLKLK